MRLELRDISVSFNSREVLRSINLSLDGGEAILIAGPSGSGKTTLLRVIAGVIPQIYGGELKGVIKPGFTSRRFSVAYLMQEPWYGVATPFVWSEMASFTSSKVVDDIKRALKTYGLEELLNRTTYTLSAGELQRLAIAVAQYSKAGVILLDEPVSHLDPINSVRVRESVKEFIREGNSAVIVDHRPSFWNGIISKAYIIRNGMLKRYDGSIYEPYIGRINRMTPPKGGGEEVLRVKIKEYRHPGSHEVILKNVSLRLHRGEIATVLGPSGVGKSTLLRIISSARIIPSKKISIAIKGRLIYIPDNPLLFYTAPTLIKEVGEKGVKYLRLFGLSNTFTTPIGKLSTGERRRGAIASALARKASVILMDEPTIGLDPINKYRVMDAIVRASEKGLAFLIATHDADLIKISNEVYRLN